MDVVSPMSCSWSLRAVCAWSLKVVSDTSYPDSWAKTCTSFFQGLVHISGTLPTRGGEGVIQLVATAIRTRAVHTPAKAPQNNHKQTNIGTSPRWGSTRYQRARRRVTCQFYVADPQRLEAQASVDEKQARDAVSLTGETRLTSIPEVRDQVPQIDDQLSRGSKATGLNLPGSYLVCLHRCRCPLLLSPAECVQKSSRTMQNNRLLQ